MGYEILRGAMNPCNSCRESKAKKEPIPNISERKPSSMPNQLMFLDLATVKKPRKWTTMKKISKPVWRLIVDDYSELEFWDFCETKDSMAEPTCELIHLWREAKLPVKVIRYDNAGESKVLQQRLRSKDWKINTIKSYTSVEQSSEKKFDTITGWKWW